MIMQTSPTFHGSANHQGGHVWIRSKTFSKLDCPSTRPQSIWLSSICGWKTSTKIWHAVTYSAVMERQQVFIPPQPKSLEITFQCRPRIGAAGHTRGRPPLRGCKLNHRQGNRSSRNGDVWWDNYSNTDQPLVQAIKAQMRHLNTRSTLVNAHVSKYIPMDTAHKPGVVKVIYQVPSREIFYYAIFTFRKVGSITWTFYVH